MPRRIRWSVVLALAMTGYCPVLAGAFARLDERIRNRIEAAGIPARIVIRNELVHASIALPAFYQRRLYHPAWSDDAGGVAPWGHELIEALGSASQEGLGADDYHLDTIERISREVSRRGPVRETANLRAELDILLTDAFLIYGTHLLSGRVDPASFDSEWHVPVGQSLDLVELLEEALVDGGVARSLRSLIPGEPGYAGLKKALARYREHQAQGEWPEIPAGPKLDAESRGPRVVLLRRRLAASGDLAPSMTSATHEFDAELRDALISFQRRHGLDDDGVLGPATLEALNVPAQQRVRQIELNLERWRWLPEKLGERHLLVNIPSFELDVVERGQTVLRMRVVVGKPYRRTPVFSATMTYLVLSPYWHVPTNLAVLDIVPAVQKDLGYLARKGIRVFDGWGSESREVDPATLDWKKLGRGSFPYRLRQEPGPENALGGVKFMFPNPYNVYLHDTPSRELFSRAERTFSSGCIRVEKPLELAKYLLQDAPRWTPDALGAAIEKRVEETVRLPQAVPIHLEYWTAWFVPEEGRVHFRKDIYGRDERLDRALREQAPSPRKHTR